MKNVMYYGNEVSEEGKKNNRVDYDTFAKAFQHVYVSSDLFNTLEFRQISGFVDNDDEIEELEEEIEELKAEVGDDQDPYDSEYVDRITDLEDQIDELKAEMENEKDIFQYYIVPETALECLKENNEIVYYNDSCGLYLWGVTHYGTNWKFVLTGIKLNEEEE